MLINMIDTNTLIVKFMHPDQISNIRDHNRVVFREPIDFQTTWFLEELLYHKSWDWLMTVVERVESINLNGDRFDVNINGTECQVFGIFENISYCDKDGDSKLLNTYNAIIKFIEWYNKILKDG